MQYVEIQGLKCFISGFEDIDKKINACMVKPF